MKTEQPKPLKEGWGWPLNSKFAHYFRGGRSLCCRWMFLGDLELGNNNSADNCTRCKKELAKEGAK